MFSSELLERDGFASIHHQSIQFLESEMFKGFKVMSPQIVEATLMFRVAVPCQLRKQTNFLIPSVHSVFSGTESIKLLRPKIWEFLPHQIKQLHSLKKFKKTLKQWKPTCPCRLCKNLYAQVWFYLKKDLTNKSLVLTLSFSFSLFFIFVHEL